MRSLRPVNQVLRLFGKERANKCVKPGAALVIDSVPHRVISITQGKRGKGGGFVRARLKSLVSNNTFEKTFTSDEIVEEADLEKVTVQYSWNDGNEYIFIDTTSFEETRVNTEIIDKRDFLCEGQEVTLLKFGEEVIGVQMPIVCEYTVTAIDVTKSL